MALFTKKTWKNRLSEYPNRRKLTKENGTTELVTVARSEGTVSQEGDAFSAANMNNLENRISKAIGTGDIPEDLGTDIISAINALNTGLNVIGEVKSPSTTNVNVTSGDTITPTNICSIWLLPGTYLIDATATFTLPKQAQVEVHVNSSDGEDTLGTMIQTLPAGIQWLKNVGIFTVTGNASKNIILRVRQNSGSTLSCRGSLWVLRIR